MSTFDTVRFSLTPHPWCLYSSSDVPDEWTLHSGYRNLVTKSAGGKLFHWQMLQHEPSGLRVGGTRDFAEWVEVSLPRLLYGSNGYLLRPMDVPSALNMVREKIAVVAPDCQLDQLVRADIAHHLEVDRMASLAALHGVRHPRVRSDPREFFGTGLEWIGSAIVIRLYDKSAEQNGIAGDLMRLEFQLRTKALAKMPALWDGTMLDVEVARQLFRSLALEFEPKPVAQPGTLVQFLALLQRESVQLAGRPALDVFLSMKSSPKYQRRLRSRVLAEDVPEFILQLDWLLPFDAWPKLVDCPPMAGSESLAA